MMEDFFFSSLISQQVVAASFLHSLHMIMMISLFMSYCRESYVRLIEGQKCSLLILTIFHSFFVARGGMVKVKLQKVAFYRGAMVLLLQDYALQIRRLQPSHAAMLAPRGPRLPDHMAATLPTDQITQIQCAKTTLLATSFPRRSSRFEVLNFFYCQLLGCWGVVRALALLYSICLGLCCVQDQTFKRCLTMFYILTSLNKWSPPPEIEHLLL